MWSPDHQLGFFDIRRMLPAVLAALLVLMVGACGLRPMYAPLPDGSRASDNLRAIEILEIRTRVGQKLRNDLIFGFTGGDNADSALYELKIVLTKNVSSVSVEQFSDTPAAKLLTLNASFILTDIASGRTLLSGSNFANASYDFSDQRYANIRAERDAENRAAKVVAEDLQARIAAYFVTLND